MRSGWSNYARAKDDCADVPIHSWVRGVAKRLLYKQLMACGGRWSCAAQSVADVRMAARFGSLYHQKT